MFNLKNIHIGNLINLRVKECGVEMLRICNFMKCTEEEIEQMYIQQDLSTDVLLKWSKLLEYDFFRLYSQHLILYSPPSGLQGNNHNEKKTSLPQFRKNIYTKEIIEFILEQIESNQMTKNQVIERYKIPKTTLYKWLIKYTR